MALFHYDQSNLIEKKAKSVAYKFLGHIQKLLKEINRVNQGRAQNLSKAGFSLSHDRK